MLILSARDKFYSFKQTLCCGCPISSLKVIVLLVVGSLVTACGGNVGSPASSLNRGLNLDPESLDPHLYSSSQAATVLRDIGEGLITIDQDGSLVGGAAESWSISEDGRVYTFKLRPGLRWSNGEDLTALHFVDSYRRLVSPSTGSSNAHLLIPVKNAAGVIAGEIDPSSLAVRALDDNTLEIELASPTGYFLQLLTLPSTFPVYSSDLNSDAGSSQLLVTNGAYRVVRREINSVIVLLRNPNYWNDEGTKIDNVVYHIVSQDMEPNRFLAGELDITNNVTENVFQTFATNHPDSLRVAPMLGVYYYGFNLDTPWLRDSIKLRQALSLAIDREVLVEKVIGRGEVPAYSVVPPGIPGYANPEISFSSMSQDEKAKTAQRLLKEAGYSDSKRLQVKLLMNTGGGHEKIAVAIQAMWKENLDVDVSIEAEEFKVFISNVRSRIGTELFRLSWTGDFNDPVTFLQMFDSNSSYNLTGFSSPKVDDLLRQARIELDTDKRMSLLSAAERAAIEAVPVIPIYFYVSKHLVNPRVKGWRDNVLDIHLSRQLSVDVTKSQSGI